MEYRLADRKSGILNSGMGSRDTSIERPCQPSFAIEFRSTVCLCVCLLLVSLVALCALDPGKVLEQSKQSSNGGPDLPSRVSFGSRILQSSSGPLSIAPSKPFPIHRDIGHPALHGMGIQFRQGTSTMSELIVAHIMENVSVSDFRLFLRALHRSGATARADVVLLYDSLPEHMMSVMNDEEVSFQKLLSESHEVQSSHFTDAIPLSGGYVSIGPFDSAPFWKHANRGKAAANDTTEQEGPRWGSIIGFDLQELDPENALKGFLDMPSVQLRRWLCYPMFLGMVRQKYRHVMLTEVQGVVFVGDPFAAVRNKKQILYLSSEDRSWNDLERTGNDTKSKEHEDEAESNQDSLIKIEKAASEPRKSELQKRKGKKSSDSKKKGGKKGKSGSQDEKHARRLIEVVYGKDMWNSLDKFDKSRRVVSSGVILGDMRLIRSLASKMATEIVRVSLERKSRQLFPDKAILNYLVYKSSVLGKRTLDHLRVLENRDSIVHCLRGSKHSNVFFRGKGLKFAVVHGYRDEYLEQQGRGEAIAAAVQKDICSSPSSAVYGDCTEGSRSST